MFRECKGLEKWYIISVNCIYSVLTSQNNTNNVFLLGINVMNEGNDKHILKNDVAEYSRKTF